MAVIGPSPSDQGLERRLPYMGLGFRFKDINGLGFRV